MTTCIALLRGINLAGKRRLGMADLRGLLETTGMRGVRTLLQSGNVVFETDRAPAKLEILFEEETSRALGLETEFFIRTADEWKGIVAKNPFPAEAKKDPQHLLLHVLKKPTGAAQLKALQAAIRDREVAKGGTPAHVYLVYPDGIGRSRLTAAILDRHLGRGTARNWNTVLKLLEMTEA